MAKRPLNPDPNYPDVERPIARETERGATYVQDRGPDLESTKLRRLGLSRETDIELPSPRRTRKVQQPRRATRRR